MLRELNRPLPGGPVWSWGDNPVFIVIGVLVTLVTFGLAIEAPGLLVVLALATAPALIRAIVVKRRAQTAGQPRTTAADLGIFVSSLGAVALVGSIAAAAGIAAFFPVCLGLASLGVHGDTPDNAGVFAGIALGFIVFASLIRLLWKRRKT